MRYKYELIVQKIKQNIKNREWKEDGKIPSIEKLSILFDVSKNTVLKAIEVLEEDDYIYVIKNRGAFIKRKIYHKKIYYPDEIESLNKKVLIILSNSLNDKSFGSAVLNECIIPTNSLNKILRKISNSLKSELFTLIHPPGLFQLREQIAKLMESRGVFVQPTEVVITTGDNSAITLCMKQLLRPGKRIGVIEPSYFGYFQSIRDLNVEPVLLPTKADESLDVCGTRVLIETGSVAAIIVNPTLQNPTGHTLSNLERKELFSTCAAHDCAILEDDVFFDLYTGPEQIRAIKHFDTNGLVTYISSFSKTISPGLRVGWCIPGLAYSSLVDDLNSRNISVNSLGQQVAAEMLKSGVYHKHISKIASIFVQQQTLIRNLIEEQFPAGTKISSPQGGFIYWIQLPDGSNPTQILERFALQNLSITPSDVFGVSPRTLFIRLCVGRLLTDEIQSEIIALGQAASSCYTDSKALQLRQ